MKTTRIIVTILASICLLPAGCGDNGLPALPDPGSGTIDNSSTPGIGTKIDPILESTAGASAVAVADFTNDGVMDLVSISSENQPVQIHPLNTSTGAFDLVSIAGGGPLAIMVDVAAADFNGDGKMDIAVLANDTGFAPPDNCDKLSALVLLIQGADPLDFSDWTHVEPPRFCAAGPDFPTCNFMFYENATGALDMTVGDFNSDGYPDVAVTSNEPEETTFIYVLMNPGPAQVTDSSKWTKVIADMDANDFVQVEAVDLDRNGAVDLVAAASTAITYNLRWLRNTNGNGLTWGFGEVGEQTGGANCFAVGDINADGNPDVAAAHSGSTLVQWFYNPGPAALSPGVPLVPWYVYNVGFVNEIDGSQTPATSINHLYLKDTDADGELETFATGNGVAYEYQRSSTLTNPWTGTAIFATNPAGVIGWLGFYDFGGNGIPDIVVPVDRANLVQDGIFLFDR
jgi:hypothetical protein